MTDLTLYEYSEFSEEEIKSRLIKESNIILYSKADTVREPKNKKRKFYNKRAVSRDLRLLIKSQFKSILSCSRFLLKRNYNNP